MSDIKKTDLYWIIKPIWDSKGYVQGYEEFRSIPSADVAPVRHGRWVVIDAEEPRRYGCSECKRLSWNMENYCGNCGAKMDARKDNPSTGE